MNRIYELNRSDKSWGYIDFMKHQTGAIHVPFEGDDYFANYMIMFQDFPLPKEIYFASDFNIIPEIDYPHNDFDENIMSLKMFNILYGLSSFKHRSIPTKMCNHKEMEAYHIEEGLLLEELKDINNDYVMIQIIESTNAFDKENSDYDPDFLDPKEIGYVDRLVLKTPTSGFPPIFKIEEKATSTFVTEEAKNALEAAGIKGCIFEEVEVSS